MEPVGRPWVFLRARGLEVRVLRALRFKGGWRLEDEG